MHSKGEQMEPLLNYKRISAWSMLTLNEWEQLQSKKLLTSHDKKRAPMPGDEWIMQQLKQRSSQFFGGQPVMSVYKPSRFSKEGHSIVESYFETTAQSELVIVEYKIDRCEVLALTHPMYLWVQRNMYIALSSEESVGYQMVLEDKGYGRSSYTFSDEIQSEISDSWDNIFHPDCMHNYQSEFNIYLASCSIELRHVSLAEKVRKSEYLFPAGMRWSDEFYDPATPAVAEFATYFLL